MPRQPSGRVPVTVKLDPGTIAAIDEQAAAASVDRSEMIRRALASKPDPGIDPKLPAAELTKTPETAWVVLPAGAAEYARRRAVVIGKTPEAVVLLALREYAKDHPLPPAPTEPAPMEDESGQQPRARRRPGPALREPGAARRSRVDP